MSAIRQSQLTSYVHNEIYRDLITLLYTYNQNPGASQCKKVAALLVSKYPFMSDTGMNKSVRPHITYMLRLNMCHLFRGHGNKSSLICFITLITVIITEYCRAQYMNTFRALWNF